MAHDSGQETETKTDPSPIAGPFSDTETKTYRWDDLSISFDTKNESDVGDDKSRSLVGTSVSRYTLQAGSLTVTTQVDGSHYFPKRGCGCGCGGGGAKASEQPSSSGGGSTIDFFLQQLAAFAPAIINMVAGGRTGPTEAPPRAYSPPPGYSDSPPPPTPDSDDDDPPEGGSTH